MKHFLTLSLIAVLSSCITTQKKDNKNQTAKADTAQLEVELLLNEEPLEETKKLNIEFVLYDNAPLDEEANISDKLNHISEQLHTKYNLAKQTDTVRVHVWRDYEDYLAAQKRITGTEFRGSRGYIFGPTDIGLFYDANIIEAAEHEFVHASSLAINDQLGHKNRWLWEAFAIYEANEFIHPKDLAYLRKGEFPSMAELNGEFSGESANRIYEVGFLLSEFVVENWSEKKYLELIQEAGDIEKTLAITIAEFEIKWKKFVTEKYLKKLEF